MLISCYSARLLLHCWFFAIRPPPLQPPVGSVSLISCGGLLFIPVMSVKQIIFGQYLNWDAAWRQICFKLLRLLLWLYIIDKYRHRFGCGIVILCCGNYLDIAVQQNSQNFKQTCTGLCFIEELLCMAILLSTQTLTSYAQFWSGCRQPDLEDFLLHSLQSKLSHSSGPIRFELCVTTPAARWCAPSDWRKLLPKH